MSRPTPIPEPHARLLDQLHATPSAAYQSAEDAVSRQDAYLRGLIALADAVGDGELELDGFALAALLKPANATNLVVAQALDRLEPPPDPPAH